MFKKLSTVAVIATGFLCSLNVQAATYSLGTLTSGDNEFGAYTVGTGNFSDRIEFDLANLTNLSAGVGSLKVTVGAAVKRDISNLSIQIFDNANNLLPTAFGSTADNLAVSFALPAGQYYSLVTGTGTGSLGGKYGGVFNVSPVPEPETWAMMAAGLGLVNLAAARRKKKAISNA